MPGPADKGAGQVPEVAPAASNRRRNWLSFSLRSLMILVTLCCLVVGGKLKYDCDRSGCLRTPKS